MKKLVVLLVLNGFVNSSGADEFKLEFSKDFLMTNSQQFDITSTQPLNKTPTENNPFPGESNPIKAQPQQPLGQPDSQLSTSTKNGLGQIPDGAANNPGQKALFEAGSTLQLVSQSQNIDDPFNQMRDDLRLIVGEEVYAKMVWSYLDVKQLDYLIYSKMSQYDLLVQEWIQSVQEIFGLNDQLKADLVIGESPDAESRRLRLDSLNSQHAQLQQSIENGLAADRLNRATVVDFENQSKLFKLFKYLTIKNLLYLTLSIAGAVYLAKLFKFLVRQQ